MYLRRCYRQKDGKRHGYWALVESYRTSRGPRQRVVAYLGEMDAAGRLGLVQQAGGPATIAQRGLFRDVEPQWVEVDVKRIAVERKRSFGGPWLGLELCRRVGLTDFIERTLPTGQEEIPWPVMAQILILARLCHPSSELHIAEHFYESSAFSDLLGVPADKVNEDRLYRALDQLLPHKEALEKHLKHRLGELFELDYDLLLYDVTSTYFEGEAKQIPLAQRGYSRDRRPDCKQVNIALVVSREGTPLGYQLFAGNRSDVTTLEEIVERMERLYGRANRIWVMDRGMISEENVRCLQKAGRRYVVGTPKSMLRRFERELLAKDWHQVHEGLEVRFCPAPGGEEIFLLCRSALRKEKERAMHERFEKRIEEGLEKIAASCRKRKQAPVVVAQRVGRLLGRNSRAAGAFQVQIVPDVNGFAKFSWKKSDRWRQWAWLSEGCYLLRSNVTDWSPQELWRVYMQLTEAEAAFRIQKSDLQLRPIWHQKPKRVEAHILVCFLAFVLWKTLAQLCHRAGLGDEPRKVFQELAEVALVDVLLPTRNGVTIRKRCISRPTEHQAILLQRLNLELPSSLEMTRV
ncbi:MAG TPA: IS1634 family transposase [Candidatus Acidoferrales bacterium]|jgi:transposase|nr:IS1634 family transposase [Candidatus Acidoferrales bacterium]